MKLQKRVLTSVTTFLFLTVGTSFAAHPIVSDDAGTLGKGTVQIEINGDVGTDKEAYGFSTVRYHSTQIASTVAVGVADNIDMTFGVTRPWGGGDDTGISFNDAGSTDFSLSIKLQAFEKDGFRIAVKPQLCYSYTVGVPGDDHTMSYGAAVIFTKEIEPIAFHLNLGYAYNDYRLASTRKTNRRSIWSVSFATTYELIKERLKLVADFGTATIQDKIVNEMPAFCLGGLIYTVNKSVDLSTGIKVGLNKPEYDLSGTIGVTLKY